MVSLRRGDRIDRYIVEELLGEGGMAVVYRARHATLGTPHAVKMLKAAGVSAMAVALYGDVSNVSGVLGAAPVLLRAKHSREFEIEADVFAKQWLKEHHIEEAHFDAILCRLAADNGESRSTNFFASHPPTSERARCADVN